MLINELDKLEGYGFVELQKNIISGWILSSYSRLAKRECSAMIEDSTNRPRTWIRTRVYKKRWFLLLLFDLYSSLVSGQWVAYCIISNIISKYYGVSSFAVNCTSTIFLLSYGIFVFPIAYLCELIGLRWSMIMGSGLNCAGAVLKILAIPPDKFWIILVGQIIVAASSVVMLSMPGQVAANWFGANELSTATSIGILGNLLGIAMWFYLPPIIVKNHEDSIDIRRDIACMYWILAVTSIAMFILIIIFFQNDPKIPPSKTRALQQAISDEDKEKYFVAVKNLFMNESFLILFNSHGLGIGILNVWGTFLNQLFLLHFKDKEEDAGRVGLLIIVSGMVGSIILGIILDKTHKFKETAVTVYICIVCGQILFSFTMLIEVMWMVYVTSIFLGFFLTGYLFVGYELAVEYTYPVMETNSAGILNISNNIYGVIIALAVEVVLEYWGEIIAHVMLCLILLSGLIMTVLTKDVQKRQDVRMSRVEF